LAVLEADRTRVPGRIAAARTAILDRAEELFTRPEGEESRLLSNALRTQNLLEEPPHRRDEGPSQFLTPFKLHCAKANARE